MIRNQLGNRTQCEAITQHHQQCRHYALPGSRCCAKHDPSIRPVSELVLLRDAITALERRISYLEYRLKASAPLSATASDQTDKGVSPHQDQPAGHNTP